MNEDTINMILQVNLTDENIWRIVDPKFQIQLLYDNGFHYMMIPSNSTPFIEKSMAGPITWKLIEKPPLTMSSNHAMILRFPSKNTKRLYPFLLELIEACGTEALSSTTALQIAKEWEDLWKKGTQPLSKEQQRGLIAELIVLKNLLVNEGSVALSLWKGPEGGLHDFVLNSCSIEVKSHGALSKVISVSSLEQLEPLKDSILKLCCIGLMRNESGMSLGEWVQEITSILPENLHSRFMNKLKEVGFNQVDEVLYRAKYAIDQIMIGEIKIDSKTLHHGKLKTPNPALKGALYKLDSSILDLVPVSVEEQLN